ncbi:MAG: InlB B-repeat-containing protein [Bacteroidaceae bacterium]|nr:InlB B-repeat-containing protein [Bacteroidaceae bacterium]
MFPNFASSSGTSGYASYVQYKNTSGSLVTVATAGTDSYGYSAIFGSDIGKQPLVLKAKQTSGTDEVYLYDPELDTFIPLSSSNQHSAIRADEFETSREVRYYTIRFDDNVDDSSVKNMPTQSYSFDGESVWGYILRHHDDITITRTATISNPTRTGYTFKGWSTNKNATSGTKGTSKTTLTIETSDAAAGEDGYNDGIVYYAIWEPKPYTITVDCKINDSYANFPNIKDTSNTTGGYASYIVTDSGTTKAGTAEYYSASVLYGSQYTIKAKDSYRSSRIFYLDSGGLPTSSETSLTMGSSNKTNYTVSYYTITFEPNGTNVSNMPASLSSGIYGYKLVGTTREITGLPTPTRTGYTFKGWALTPTSTTSKGTTTLNVTDNWAAGGEKGTADGIVFYAIWEANEYTVTVNCTINGSTANFPNINDTANTTGGYAAYIQHDGETTKAGTGVSTFSEAIPFGDTYVIKVKDHYNRIFYFNSSKNIVEASQTLTKGANNTTFTAKYYTIKFNDNVSDSSVSGMPTASDNTIYGYKLIGSTNKTMSGLSQPTRAGYTFLGWSTNKDATASSSNLQGKTSVTVSDASATADGDATNGIIVYAIWERNNYTITVKGTVNGSAGFANIASSAGEGLFPAYIVVDGAVVASPSSTSSGSFTYTLPYGSKYQLRLKDRNSTYYCVDSSGKIVNEGVNLTVTGNKTYTVGHYTIRFDPNAGNSTVTNMPATSYTQNGTAVYAYKLIGVDRNISPSSPTRTGYTFKGWALSSGGTPIGTTLLAVEDGHAGTTAAAQADGIVYYAIWEPDNYTVTVDCKVNDVTANFPDIKSSAGNSGYASYIQNAAQDTTHATAGTGKTSYSYTLKTDDRYVIKVKDAQDRIFYLNSYGSVTPDESILTMGASNKTFTVGYYTIRFDPNAGNDTVTNMPTNSYGTIWGYKVKGQARTISGLPHPVRAGYTFVGWSTTKSATGGSESLQDMSRVTVTDASAAVDGTEDGIVVYAIWEPNAYTVTVKGTVNGSAGFANIPSSTTGTGVYSAYIQVDGVTKAHPSSDTSASFTYQGAYGSKYVLKIKDRTNNIVYESETTIRASNSTTYVDFFTIRFDPNGDSVTGMPATSYTQSGVGAVYGYVWNIIGRDVTVNNPTREGYTFLGWALSSKGTPITPSSSTSTSTTLSLNSGHAGSTTTDKADGIVLYAIWKANGYDITVGCLVNNKEAKFPNITNVAGTEGGFASYIKTGSDVAVKAGASNSVYTVTLPYGTEYTLMAKHEQSVVYYVDSNGNIVTGATTHTLGARDDNYIIKYYTIRFDANAGNDNVSGMPTQSYSFDSKKVWGYKLVGPNRVISGLSEPTREGYTFLGWSTNKDATSSANGLQGKSSVEVSDASATADGDATNGIVLYAIWKQETPPSDPTFVVTWVDEDGTVLETDTDVPYGTDPSYDSELPTKESDERYDYIFDGWTPEITPVTEDITYTATYIEVPRTFTVTWVDEDGTVLEVDTEVPYGATPSFDKSTPTKAATAQYTYTFTGWTPAIVPVTKDAVYTATYMPTLRTYTITWVDEDGTVLETDTDVPYGTIPSYDDEPPTKEGDYQYTYEFDDWTPTVVPVTSDAVYEATYEPVPIKYNVVIYTRVNDRAAKPFANYGSVVVNGVEQSIGSASFSLSLRYGDEIDIRVAEYRDAALKSLHNKVVTGDMTFYIDYYTLTLSGDEGISKLEVYNSDGNTAIKSGPILKGTKVSPLATTAPTHIFDEWTYVLGTGSPFSAPEGNTAENPMKLYWPDITINERTSIKAHSLTHRIIFDKNDPDATGTMDDQYVRPGTGDVLDKNEFSNEGKIFVGWNTEPDGSGDYYSDEDYFVAPAGEGGTTTLYAQWGIRVIYNANTGNTSNGSYSIDADGYVCRGGVIFEDIFDQNTSKTIHSYIDFGLNKSGSTCLGWVYDLSDVEGSKISASVYTLEDLEAYADESGTVTLYAVWSLQTHKVDFTTVPANDAYGKVVLDNVSVDYITGVPHGSGMLQEGYKVTVTVAQDAVITVYFNNGTSKVVSLAKDETIVFTAAPKMNTVQYTYNFTSWSGAPLLVLNDVDVVATFTRAPNTFKASFLVEPPDYGRVSKSRVVDIPYGTTVTYDGNTVTLTGPSGSGFTKTIVTATPAPSTDTAQYSFVGWEGPTSVVRNIEIVAHFKVNTMMDVAIVANDIIGNPKEGSVFTASANIVNLSSQHVGFYDGMVVVLEVVDANGNVVASYEKDMVPVPKMGSNNATASSTFITTSQDADRNGTLYTAVKYDNTNFVYFAIDANLAKGNYTLRWSLDFSESVVVEVGGTNNTDTVSVTVGKKAETSNTDRPDFSTDIPSSFKNKDHGEEQTSNSFSWYEIDIYYTDSQTFHAKRLTNGLDVVMLLTPENEAGLKQEDVVLFGIPDYVTRAGYGFSLHQPRSGLGLSINGYSGINASTVIAGANTFGIPEALMTYPEFDYSKDKGKSTTLMVAETSSGTKYLAFALAFPEYKDYQSNDVNDRFAHYIPMWYPDGEYTPVTYFSGAWSPLGEMTATVVQGDERVTSGLTGATDVGASETMMSRRHIFTSILEILGSLYDDIYITG